MIAALNIARIINAVAGFSVACILMWRARRWIGRFSEPAWLHISTALLVIAAGMNALDHLGDRLTRFTFFNIMGTVFAWIFVIRTPVEKNFSWKEHRGEPPDWRGLGSDR